METAIVILVGAVVALVYLLFFQKEKKKRPVKSNNKKAIKKEVKKKDSRYSSLMAKIAIEDKFKIDSDELPQPAEEYMDSIKIFDKFQHEGFSIAQVGYPTAVISQLVFRKMSKENIDINEVLANNIDTIPTFNEILKQVNENIISNGAISDAEKDNDSIKEKVYAIAYRHNQKYILQSIKDSYAIIDVYDHLLNLAGKAALPQYFKYDNEQYNIILNELRGKKKGSINKAYVAKVIFRTLKASGHDNHFLNETYSPEKIFEREAEMILDGKPIIWFDLLRKRIKTQWKSIKIMVPEISKKTSKFIFDKHISRSDVMGKEKVMKEKIFKL